MPPGPILIFDKSALQALSVDEANWLDNFFMTNITPLFFAETLADLEKEIHDGRTPEQIVGNLALKTPDMNSTACAHHWKIMRSVLAGREMPMDGRIPLHQDNRELRNELILKDSQLFELLSVELLCSTGAKMADISIGIGEQLSTGFRVHIPHAQIIQMWNRNYRQGSIRCSVRRGDHPWTGEIPFVGEEAHINRTVWIKLVG